MGAAAQKIDEDDGFRWIYFTICAEIGILGITISEEDGGSMGTCLMQVLAIEDSRGDRPALAMSYGTHSNPGAHNIQKNADGFLKERFSFPPRRAAKR